MEIFPNKSFAVVTIASSTPGSILLILSNKWYKFLGTDGCTASTIL